MGGTILAADPTNAIERYEERIHDHRQAIEVFKPPYAITMNWASRRAVLEELGGFDERFLRGQDVDLSYRILQSGRTLAFAPDAIVRHHNERTLGGLAREGFTHGFHGVQADKRPRRVPARPRARSRRPPRLRAARTPRRGLGARARPRDGPARPRVQRGQEGGQAAGLAALRPSQPVTV